MMQILTNGNSAFSIPKYNQISAFKISPCEGLESFMQPEEKDDVQK